MKKIFIINIFILILFCFGCNQEKKQQNQITTKSKVIDDVDKSFSQFLKKFSRDSIFQINRVKFPLKIKKWIDPETGMVEKLISKTEYTKLDFSYPKDATTREYDRYTQKIKVAENKCVVEIRGIDNGIFTDYFFEKINGKWNLISWNEQST